MKCLKLHPSLFCKIYGRLRSNLEYKGELEATKTYRAKVNPDKNFGINFVIPFRPPFHQTYQIKWLN